jgi:hypothetical protein
MSAPICAACGTWYPESAVPPASCPICEDDRQYVPRTGQRWLSPDGLAAGFVNRIEEDDGVLGIGMEPAFAINQRCVLVEAAAGTVMWETTSLVTDAAVAAIRQRGPVSAIAISHPHFYAAMHQWAQALDCPIVLPEADRGWVQRPSERIRFWQGDRLELLAGVTLIRCGGHFDGSSVLHWQDDRCPQGALFVGDTVQVSADRKRVSVMHSYPNAIPLGRGPVETIAASLAGLRFERVYGYTWGRNIAAAGDQVVARSLADYVRAITRS